MTTKREAAAGEQERFETWAIVEIFGHQTFVGVVTEQTIGGCNFVRVDVPALEEAGGYPAQPAFTKLFGQGAIYSITPVSNEAGVLAAARMRTKPVTVYIPPVRQISSGEDDDE